VIISVEKKKFYCQDSSSVSATISSLLDEVELGGVELLHQAGIPNVVTRSDDQKQHWQSAEGYPVGQSKLS